MAHVFLSYSHEDQAYAAKLAKSIRERDIKVWMDSEIDYGTKFTREIRKHLDRCDAVVLIMSPASEDSEWVANEIERAKRKGKPVVPLLLKGDKWLQLETTRHVDVTKGQLPPKSFYKRLRSIIKGERDRSPDKASEPHPVPVLAEQIETTLEVGPPPYASGQAALHASTARPQRFGTTLDIAIVKLGKGYLALASQRHITRSVLPDEAASLESRGWGPVPAYGPIRWMDKFFTPKLVFPALQTQSLRSSARIAQIASGKAIAWEVAAAFVEVWGQQPGDVSVAWSNHSSPYVG